MRVPITVPRNKRYGNNYWNSEGPKVEMREVILYSDLEFDHWLLVETNPLVEIYCEQHKEISFVIDGKLHTSIFDMWIKYTNGEEEYTEVKYENELVPTHPNYTRNMRQIQAQKEWCEQEGVAHKLMTDKIIRVHPIGLENRLKMLSAVKAQHSKEKTEDILKNISRFKQTIGSLHEHMNGKYNLGDVMAACYWLTYTGKTLTNINDQLWSLSTEIWRAETDAND